MILKDIELLRELCLCFGPSGCEDRVRELIYEQIKDFCDDITIDRMGNLIAVVHSEKADAKKIMVSAHMDEVGFMICDIDSDGYLKFCTVGGIDPRVLSSRAVTVGDENRQTDGIIGSLAIHHQNAEDRKKITPIDKMYIDIGANSKEDAEKYVGIGDFGTFKTNFVLFGKDDKMMRAKAIDDRLGCTVMIEIIRYFAEHKDKKPDCNIAFSFSVREEVGLSGALTAADSIHPDFAIVLESTAIADIADVPENSRVAKVGDGGVISLLDRSTIYDAKFIEFALQTAKENNIAVQIKKYLSGGNDANHIHKSREGVRTLALSAPTRYLHSASCVAKTDDYFAIKELTLKMLENSKNLFERYIGVK